MKVPRPFSIADVSDMASPRVRQGPAALGLFKQTVGSHREPARRDGSLLAHARPCAHNAGRLCESRRA